jgi:general secretion pathway protein G
MSRNRVFSTHRRPRNRQRGLTLLEIMIVIAILGLLVVIVVPRVVGALGESRDDLTRVQVNDIAKTWYQRWSIKSGESCPGSLLEVARAVEPAADEDTVKDPWGTPYQFKCGSEQGLPEGVPFGVWSLGEDKKDGTADDIKSWELKKKK